MRHWNRSSGRYFNPTPPQTIACSAFYEAEVSAKPQYFELQRLSNRYHRTRTGCGTAIDVPGGGPNQSIEVGQIELTETTHRDLGDDITHQHPFPYNAVRAPAVSKARMRKIRKAAKAAAKDRRLGPKGWKDQLQGLINENNWRHATKPKGVSGKTKKERATFLHATFRTLYSAKQKFKAEPRNLTNTHVECLVKHWVVRGLCTGTLQVYMSHLRTFCEWIHHPGMILPLGHYLSDPALAKRTCVAREDKSWIGHGVVPAEKLAEIRAYDARASCWLLLCLVFGARLKEVLMMRPHLAEIDGQLLLTCFVPAASRSATQSPT
jgi:integrase-like protein